MLPLKAYLLHWQPDEGWNITVHRDFESLATACKLAAFEHDHTVVIHIGFWRPDADAFLEAVKRFPGVILVTSAAKDALPRPLATTHKPVCLVEELGLYPILSGWGYEIAESDFGDASVRQRHPLLQGIPLLGKPTPLAIDPNENSEWMIRLAIENSDAYQVAMELGVHDDESFFDKEAVIPDKIRSFLNIYRYKFFTGELPNSFNVLDNLYLAGPFLQQIPLNTLVMSVRATNVFNQSNIKYVHEISKLKRQGLFDLSNMGKKTVSEVAQIMMERWFPGYDENSSMDNDIFGELFRSSSPFESNVISEVIDPPQYEPLLTELIHAIDRLQGKRRMIIRDRIGLDVEPRTLEEIGKTLGVSRERIRQLEGDGIASLKRNASLSVVLTSKLDSFLKDRQSALPIFGLELLDPWFAGVSEKQYAFGWILEHCCESFFSIINHNGQCLVSRIHQDKWDELIDSTMNLMKSQVSSRISKSQAQTLVKGMLVGPGEELRDELWGTIQADLIFMSTDGCDVLVNVGGKLASIIEAILLDSPTPLHLTEIASKIMDRIGRQVEVNHLRKILVEMGFQFGRGTYGLRKHLDLTDQELDLVRMEVEEMISSTDSRRQWHSSEIYPFLAEACPDIISRITPQIIGIALKKSEKIISLGRMVWAAKQSVQNGSAFRIDIHQAIVSLIRNEGRPMTGQEIRQRLLRDRGLNNIFQIIMEDPLIRVGRGVWGLMDRDVPYSENEQKLLVDFISLMLADRQKGVHYSVLVSELSLYIPDLDPGVDPTLLLSLAQRSGSMKADMGGYLYLSDWENSRWPSSTEVVSEIISDNPSGGWTLAEILARAEAKLERPLESGYIHKAIEMLGGVYDVDAKKWFFTMGAEYLEDEI